MTAGLLKGIGLAATVVGIGANLASNWVSEKQMENTIEEKVEEALNKKEKEES